MPSEPFVTVGGIRDAIGSPFWTTAEAAMLLCLVDSRTLDELAVAVLVLADVLFTSPDGEGIDVRAPLPEEVLAEVAAFQTVMASPFWRSIQVAKEVRRTPPASWGDPPSS